MIFILFFQITQNLVLCPRFNFNILYYNWDIFCNVIKMYICNNSQMPQGIGQLDGYLACVSDEMDLLNTLPQIKIFSLKFNTQLPVNISLVVLDTVHRKASKDELY